MRRARVLALLPLLLPAPACAALFLEDAADSIAPVGAVSYDPKLNALTLDAELAYFPPVAPRDLVALCRALAEGDRVGAAGGARPRSWGVPEDSEIALNLQLAELFLEDIVRGRQDRTAGYRYAEGYAPARAPEQAGGAPTFYLRRLRFARQGAELRLADSGLAIGLGPGAKRFPQLARNARHLAEHLEYYRREKVLGQAFKYAEVAAFLRALRDSGVDLRALAVKVESQTLLLRGPRNTGGALERYWADYLRDIEARKEHANWSGPPYELFMKKTS